MICSRRKFVLAEWVPRERLNEDFELALRPPRAGPIENGCSWGMGQRLQLHLSEGVRAVESEIVQTTEGVCVRIPDDVAQRYHLEPGVQVELNPVEEGIFFRPMGVESWFSVEWERALEAVLERYRPALENINE